MLITSLSHQEQNAALRPRLLSRGGLLCAMLFGVGVLLTWPVAEIGINDDWSYIRTAQLFAQTHHFVYNGWATAMLGWQVIWGAVFPWIFGPSFTAIRLSMIPVAMLTVLLFHVILRRFGLNRTHAVFGTLVLAFNPLFIPLSDTFMSDVPGLFSLLLCIYLCQLAVDAEDDSRAAMWLVVAGITNILSGTVRQISWLGVLVVVPCCAWMLRRRRYVIPSTIATWVIGVISIKLLVAWFLRQPYSIPETILRAPISRLALQRLTAETWRSCMSTLLFLLPVLVAFSAAVWPPRKSRLVRLVAIFSVLAILYYGSRRPDMFLHPWLVGNTVTPHGVLQDSPLFGSERLVGADSQWLLVLTFAFCLVGSLEALYAFRQRKREPAETLNRRVMSALLLPMLFLYCLLLVPRAAFMIIFDRYLLVILAVVLIYMVRAHQERVGARVPLVAFVAVAILAVLSIAATHDLFAINRAEVRILQELQAADVPRLQIRGGFDFDSMSEVEATGYLNDPHLINPPGSYRPLLEPPRVLRDGVFCGYPFLRYVPALDIHYVISADPTPCLAPADFPIQSYQTWLPPARRELFIGTPLPGTPEPTP